MNRKNLLIGSALILAALLVVGGTMAWFTAAADPVINTFEAGTVEIELHDVQMGENEEEVRFPENGIGNVNPGDEYEKIVYVENTGTKAIYVRVKLTPAWTKGESSLPLQVGSVDMATFPIVGTDWVLHTDGWYYYTEPLAGAADNVANAVTTHLIEKVKFAGAAMTNDYQGATFTLTVEAEAVQASHEAYKDEWGTGITFLTPFVP
ncbi:MAG TPA: TasA family protein [Bacillota bacterium]|nr:TasA family protein [Bacillota bacterium]